MKIDIAQNPNLELIYCRQIKPEEFVSHVYLEQETLLEKCKIAGPKIIEITPYHRATDVDPALSEIKIKFDRPMDKKSRAIYQARSQNIIPNTLKPFFNESGTILTIPVSLKPGHYYYFSLNKKRDLGFTSAAEGIPLYPYKYYFTTAKRNQDTDKQSTNPTPAKIETNH